MKNKFAKLIFSKNWQDNLDLNIVIPTFNRKNNLIFLLENLAKINNPNIGIIILDNNSNIRIEINDLESISLNDIKLQLYYNDFHVCAEANHLRAMNLATSKWIYLLGDSKIPNNKILNLFINNIESINMNEAIIYSYDNKIKNSLSINNLNELFQKQSKFGDILLAGNVIIKKNVYNKYIKIVSQFTITKGTLPVFILLLLNDSNKILLSHNVIIDNFIQKPSSYNPEFELLECWARFPLLTLLPINSSNLKSLNKYIIKNENFKSRINFSKFIYIKLFRENQDIKSKLRVILKTRYIFYKYFPEYILIYILYFVSVAVSFYFNSVKKFKI